MAEQEKGDKERGWDNRAYLLAPRQTEKDLPRQPLATLGAKHRHYSYADG